MVPKCLSLLVFVAVCHGKTFDRCELAKMFLDDFDFPRNEIDDWVCLARWESHYNSSAIGTLNADGSKDLGLFQISEKWWCEHGRPGKGCDMKCEDLLDDDLTDDVECVRRIFKEHRGLSGNGFNAWVAWRYRCQGDLSKFIKGCDLEDTKSAKPKKKSKPEHNMILIPRFRPAFPLPHFFFIY